MAETPPQLLNHNITFPDGFLSHQEKGKLKSKLGLVFRGAFLHFYTKTLQSPGDTSLAGGKNLAAAFLALKTLSQDTNLVQEPHIPSQQTHPETSNGHLSS